MTHSAYAFFDVDDTLIRTKSMFSFFRYWCREWVRDPALLSAFEAHFDLGRAEKVSRERLNQDYYRFLAGVKPKNLILAGEKCGEMVIEEIFFIPQRSKN